MFNTILPFPASTRPTEHVESTTDDDELGCARGLIYWTPVSLLLWGVIIGALAWVL